MDHIVGFEELGGQNDFPTMIMIRRLIAGGWLIDKNDQEAGKMKITKGSKKRSDDYSDDEAY